MKRNRGIVDVTLLVVLGLAAFAVGGIKIQNPFAKKPPTVELTQAQADLAAARAAQQAAEARLGQLEAEHKAVGDKQLDYAQQMAAGTVIALGHLAPGQNTPETKLAMDFATRTEAGLAAYRGQLAPEARAEMERMVSQGLSAVQAERDALKLELAKKDAVLNETITQKSTLEAQILTQDAAIQVAKARTAASDAKAQELTKEVSVWAEQKVQADGRANSLDALSGRLIRGVILLAALYFFFHFILPNLAQSYPGNQFLNRINSAVKNLTTSHT